MSNFVPDEMHDYLLLCFMDGYGIRETSRETGVARNTVRRYWEIYWSFGDKPKERKGGYWDHKENKYKKRGVVKRDTPN